MSKMSFTDWIEAGVGIGCGFMLLSFLVSIIFGAGWVVLLIFGLAALS